MFFQAGLNTGDASITRRKKGGVKGGVKGEIKVRDCRFNGTLQLEAFGASSVGQNQAVN